MVKKATRRRQTRTNRTARQSLVRTYTALYTKIDSGYMGQLVEWPEVITEGKTIEECREMLLDCVNEMAITYRELKLEIPTGNCLLEPIAVTV